MTVAAVDLWGTEVGAVEFRSGDFAASFQFSRDFLKSGIQLAPITMPLREQPYSFPQLPRETFAGLPGMLADSLPDRFGSEVLDHWLLSQGRTLSDLDPVERLCYIGKRGMGAVEFRPVIGPRTQSSQPIHIDALVALASEILRSRQHLALSLREDERAQAVAEMLLVGTSAGGARAKAVIAYNPKTGNVKSGQVAVDPGYEHWILKFDGVNSAAPRNLGDPRGYGLIELAYAQMAGAAGIEMTECRTLNEGARRHFMTRRFDRLADGGKLHMQSLGGMSHADYNRPGSFSYEAWIDICKRLTLGMTALESVIRRMVFNILAGNCDDHPKNIAFLMVPRGTWMLAPAFDVTYAYNPTSNWIGAHQMTVNGKRDSLTREDIAAVSKVAGLVRGGIDAILDQVVAAVRRWPEFAAAAAVDGEATARINSVLQAIECRLLAH